MWTTIRLPDAEIIWIESYFVLVDAMLGTPIWRHSEAAQKALARGIIREISRERAEELNKRFADEGTHSAHYLTGVLDNSWQHIKMRTTPKEAQCATARSTSV